jgi:ABC-2 type transport system ATP-binding protein
MKELLSIHTENLGRTYKIRNNRKEPSKELVALKNINLDVAEGELFGVLGPNGAGKTTLIKILTTLLAPTIGSASVSGFDVTKEANEVRKRINMVSGGETSGYGLLTVRENLWMFAQFYGIDTKDANQRIGVLSEVMGLTDRLQTKIADLSTGLRQKMNIIRGFLTDPTILFLDEPTLGLDVGAAHDVRRFIKSWMKDDTKRSLLLTTHYMFEAQELCDRVAIINQGNVIACDTPKKLMQSITTDVVYQITASHSGILDQEPFKQIAGLLSFHQKLSQNELALDIILEKDAVLPNIINEIARQSGQILTLNKREATLEDVFVKLVGYRMEEAENAAPGQS